MSDGIHSSSTNLSTYDTVYKDVRTTDASIPSYQIQRFLCAVTDRKASDDGDLVGGSLRFATARKEALTEITLGHDMALGEYLHSQAAELLNAIVARTVEAV